MRIATTRQRAGQRPHAAILYKLYLIDDMNIPPATRRAACARCARSPSPGGGGYGLVKTSLSVIHGLDNEMTGCCTDLHCTVHSLGIKLYCVGLYYIKIYIILYYIL